MNALRSRILNNELTVGSWITLACPDVAEVLGQAGFDWLTVDMEHSSIGINEAQHLIRAIQLAGSVPLVRVSENDPTLIKRVLDCGAQGVIVPMVNSAEDARAAVAAVRYPPTGVRGVGLARAQAYGFGFDEYREWMVDGPIVVVQIEHIRAVEALEEILSVDRVDACLVGPYDLSASMGTPGEFENPEVLSALRRVEEVTLGLGKTLGFHVIPPDAAELEKKIAAGYRFLGFSLDTLFLGTLSRSELGKIRRS